MKSFFPRRNCNYYFQLHYSTLDFKKIRKSFKMLLGLKARKFGKLSKRKVKKNYLIFQ